MNSNQDNKILSSRILNSPVAIVYQAFANPEHLKNWWGPNGFSNTIHEFDLKPGGKWILTMHGPEIGNYENSSVFTKVIRDCKQPITLDILLYGFSNEVGTDISTNVLILIEHIVNSNFHF